MSNLELWNKVEKTDPSHTKKVNQRGGFTAIDAYYQVKNATEQFGPVGVGWGWTVSEWRVETPFFIVEIDMWHGNRDTVFSVMGCAEIMRQRPDADAPKKALTDAITKGLSYLGFNADIFLGKFDDNKYVQERVKEEKDKAKVDDHSEKLITEEIQKAISNCSTDTELNQVKAQYKDVISQVSASARKNLTEQLKAKLKNIQEGKPYDDDVPF